MVKVKNPNIDISGSTDGIIVPKGTTDQRPSATAGLLRYNTTFGVLEQSDGNGYNLIDNAPTVTGLSGLINEDNDTTITITGTGFKTGATVHFVNEITGVDIKTSPVVTRVSSTELTATTGNDSVNMTAGVSVAVRVTNTSGLSATSASTIQVSPDATFRSASGSLGTIFDSGRTGVAFDAGADTLDSSVISYSIIVGSLPTGLSLNASTGLISGNTDQVGSDTTTTFTVRAAPQSGDSTLRFSDREFSILQKAPTVEAFTTTGATTFTAPFTGTIKVAVVGGGGGGGGNRGNAGGGGAGVVYHSSFPVTSSTVYPITVGAGGSSAQIGQSSVFSNITAVGGGGADQNGGANTGGYAALNDQGGCRGTPYTSTTANTAGGGTPYGGYRGGGSRSSHYFWGGGGGGGAGGNGQEPVGCGGEHDGGVGVYLSEFSSYGQSGYFGGGGGGNQDRFDPVNPAGKTGDNGTGGSANNTGGGGNNSNSGYPGVVLLKY
jgi:hypothetical protein